MKKETSALKKDISAKKTKGAQNNTGGDIQPKT